MYFKNIFHLGERKFLGEECIPNGSIEMCDGLGLLRSQSKVPAGLSGFSGYRL